VQLEKVQGARGQLEALQETHGTESAAAAEQKAALDRMNEETQALMEAAKREQGAAEQRHVALMEVRAALHERCHIRAPCMCPSCALWPSPVHMSWVRGQRGSRLPAADMLRLTHVLF